MAEYINMSLMEKALYTIFRPKYGDTDKCRRKVRNWTDSMDGVLVRSGRQIKEPIQKFKDLIAQIQEMQTLIEQSDQYMVNRINDVKWYTKHIKDIKQLTILQTGIDLDAMDERSTYAPIPIASSTLIEDRLSGIFEPASLEWDEFEEFFMPPETSELSLRSFSAPLPDDSVHASLQMHSPSRGPVQVDVDVRPQPLVITESGEEFVCDVTVNLQAEGGQGTTHAFQTDAIPLPDQINTTFPGSLNTTIGPPLATSTPIEQILNTTHPVPLNTTMDLPQANSPVQQILNTTYPGPLNTTMDFPRADSPVQQILNTTIGLPQSTVAGAPLIARIAPRRRSPIH